MPNSTTDVFRWPIINSAKVGRNSSEKWSSYPRRIHISSPGKQFQQKFLRTTNFSFTTLHRYAGFCPQYKYRMGDTYGTTTHKLLLDPTVNHAEKLVLSDRTADDYQVRRIDSKSFRRSVNFVADFSAGTERYRHSQGQIHTRRSGL